MTGPFEDATAVDRTGPNRFAARIRPGWDIVGNANGGYLLSVTARAMARAADRPDPLSVTAHYLTPGSAGEAVVHTDVVRSGRRLATTTAVLSSQGRDILSALGTFGDLSHDHGPASHPEFVDGAPPELPPPPECRPVVPGEVFPPPFMDHVEVRLHPDDAAFLDGRRSGTARIRSWIRLPHGERIDPIALMTVVDSLPPTVFNVDLPIGWTPTVELTTHVRAVPSPGWLAVDARSRFISGGFLEVDTEVWDRGDRLVAQSRQLALVPRPATTDAA